MVAKKEETVDDSAVDREVCGLIMPISATATHDKSHWDEMLELLTRAVEAAELKAAPVWINSSLDRVSERIIGNIFNYPIVIADITDLNPNVMFELGLRLASKKPTLVVMEVDGLIPFDIRDFHIHTYPRGLSIIGMEKFLNKLTSDIRAKKNAYENGEYTPFLSKVVVDVVSPDQREVSIDQYIVDRLDDLSAAVSELRPSTQSSSKVDMPSSELPVVSLTGRNRFMLFATIAPDKLTEFQKQVESLDAETTLVHQSMSRIFFSITPNKTASKDLVSKRLKNVVDRLGGTNSVPRHISELALKMGGVSISDQE